MRQHGNISFVLHILAIQMVSLNRRTLFRNKANQDEYMTMFCADN